MKHIPRVFYKPTTQIWFYVLLPVFFLSFILLYRPEMMTRFFTASDTDSLTRLSFNLTMLTCMMMAVMAISRNLIFILRKHMKMLWLHYILWCMAEMIVTALFFGLYLTLISDRQYNYFAATGYSFAYTAMVVFFPYLILTLVFIIKSEEENTAEEPASLIRFIDNTGRLKCVVATNALLYVEAEVNNVKIKYLDSNIIKEYSLRNSMKAIEPLMTKHGIVRCQRSYYVNPAHIKVLRRDKEGIIVAELDTAGAKEIPVSPKYYEDLSKRL